MVSRGRPAPKEGSAIARQLKVILFFNSLPLALIGYVGWRMASGTLRLEQMTKAFPKDLGENVTIVLLLFMLLLGLVGSPLSLLNLLLRRIRAGAIAAAEFWSRQGFFGRAWDLLLWIPRLLAYGVVWAIRLLVHAVLGVVLALMVIFLVRLVQPDFAESWLPIEKVLSKIR